MHGIKTESCRYQFVTTTKARVAEVSHAPTLHAKLDILKHFGHFETTETRDLTRYWTLWNKLDILKHPANAWIAWFGRFETLLDILRHPLLTWDRGIGHFETRFGHFETSSRIAFWRFFGDQLGFYSNFVRINVEYSQLCENMRDLCKSAITCGNW